MNRLLASALSLLVFTSLPLAAQSGRSDGGFSGDASRSFWPWSAQNKKGSTTIIHPNPGPVMIRDHSAAEVGNRAAWQRERAIFERNHRAQLQEYVDSRVDRAGERARLSALHLQRNAPVAGVGSRVAAIYATALSGVGAISEQIAGVWLPARNQPGQGERPQTLRQKVSSTAKNALEKVPVHTKEILQGEGELVKGNMAAGLPKGLAVFMALLMLHVPSVALASFVTGIFLIRGHQPRAGILLLGVAAVLSVVIFATVSR